ncbi:unnamed protein product [Caenorhabditis auriculariae]|uniref:Uncharacterized protein n=1 Tax=Caenorhabditis auriculariae TaxID=2777116 RepID=A0A8S1GUE7_9PELO|nr:unnamed protein product [Caenorhabditis auriculariae]
MGKTVSAAVSVYSLVVHYGGYIFGLGCLVSIPTSIVALQRALNSDYDEKDRPLLIARTYLTMTGIASAFFEGYNVASSILKSNGAVFPAFHRCFPFISFGVLLHQFVPPVTDFCNRLFGLPTHIYCIVSVAFCSIYSTFVDYNEPKEIVVYLGPFPMPKTKLFYSPSYVFEVAIPILVAICYILSILKLIKPSKTKTPLFFYGMFILSVVQGMVATCTGVAMVVAAGDFDDEHFLRYFIENSTPFLTFLALAVVTLVELLDTSRRHIVQPLEFSKEIGNAPGAQRSVALSYLPQTNDWNKLLHHPLVPPTGQHYFPTLSLRDVLDNDCGPSPVPTTNSSIIP